MDESKRRVQANEGEALAAEFGIPFFETSAMNNINVDAAFTHIAKCVKDRLASSEERKKPVSDSTTNPNGASKVISQIVDRLANVAQFAEIVTKFLR